MLSQEKASLSLQAPMDQAAWSQDVASQRSSRFLWTGLGFAALMLIAVSARPLHHVSAKPTNDAAALAIIHTQDGAFVPLNPLPELSPGRNPPATNVRPNAPSGARVGQKLRPAVAPSMRQSAGEVNSDEVKPQVLPAVPPHHGRREALLPIAAALTMPLAASGRSMDSVGEGGIPTKGGNPVTSPPSMQSVDVSQYKRIEGGGRFADLALGKGPEITAGSKVSLQWVLRRSNGYYVDGSIKMRSGKREAVVIDGNFDEENNFFFTVGDGRAMRGVDAGVLGMRQGGTRRLVLPIKQAFTLPIKDSAGPLPDGFGPRRQIEREIQRNDPDNYFTFEVQATRVKQPKDFGPGDFLEEKDGSI